MMDLALLLCKLVVWKDCTLSECLPSMVLLPCRPSKEEPAETVCWAVLAVVPIVCRRPQDPRSAGKRAHSSDGRETQEEAIPTTAADTDSWGDLPLCLPLLTPWKSSTQRNVKDQLQLLRERGFFQGLLGLSLSPCVLGGGK